MDKSLLLLSLLFFRLFFSASSSSSAQCPMDLSYVNTFPWDTSLCRGTVHKDCCQTLLSLFGMGMAQHLRDTSNFQLSDANTSSSCLSDFESRLSDLSVSPSLVNQCFKNSTQFVVNPLGCAGITTAKDWIEKAGETTPLDQSCKRDLTGLTRCSSCVDAGMKVNSKLTALDPNGTKCFYLTVLYAAGIVSELGPKDPSTATCILGLPLSSSATRNSSDQISKKSLSRIIGGCSGVIIGVLLAGVLIILYRRWDGKRKKNAHHEEFVSSFRETVLPNSGAKWFRLSDLEKATNGFSQRNMIGQGSYGIVYKGTISDTTPVAVKQILDLESKGDEEFCNEVEIISKIRHRNLLSLRGCCVTSDDVNGRRRYLVYDFMPNGSLSDHLSNTWGSTNKESKLTWPQRKNWAWSILKSGNVEEVFEESIRKNGPKGIMERFVRVGILCSHVMVALRPTINEALRMLEGDIDIPKLPERPLPLSHESYRSSFGFTSITSTASSTKLAI
ncbi:hypothetical protein CsatB_001651 [Cannabis sativa]